MPVRLQSEARRLPAKQICGLGTGNGLRASWVCKLGCAILGLHLALAPWVCEPGHGRSLTRTPTRSPREVAQGGREQDSWGAAGVKMLFIASALADLGDPSRIASAMNLDREGESFCICRCWCSAALLERASGECAWRATALGIGPISAFALAMWSSSAQSRRRPRLPFVHGGAASSRAPAMNGSRRAQPIAAAGSSKAASASASLRHRADRGRDTGLDGPRAYEWSSHASGARAPSSVAATGALSVERSHFCGGPRPRETTVRALAGVERRQ